MTSPNRLGLNPINYFAHLIAMSCVFCLRSAYREVALNGWLALSLSLSLSMRRPRTGAQSQNPMRVWGIFAMKMLGLMIKTSTGLNSVLFGKRPGKRPGGSSWGVAPACEVSINIVLECMARMIFDLQRGLHRAINTHRMALSGCFAAPDGVQNFLDYCIG